jgi:hypothetical protein
MPQIVTPQTSDTASTDGTCTYPPKPLGGAPIVSPNVYIGKKQVEFYTSSTVPSTVEGVKINPLSPLPCQPGTRVIVPGINKTVYINKQLPAVQGDKAQLLGIDRLLTAPFGPASVVFASKGN